MEYLLEPGLLPFSVAAATLAGLVAVEALSLLSGFSLSELADKSLDLDHEAGAGAALGWLNVGRVPLLVLLMVALAAFSVIGMGVQAAAGAVAAPLPAWAASIAALAASLPAVRLSSRAVARVVPREETYAIELSDLVGKVATVTVGPLDGGLPGLAAVVDSHGNRHAVRARAAADTPDMLVGEEIVLVSIEGGAFTAIPFAAPMGELTYRKP